MITKKRLNSIAIAGGVFGDEGKGKIVDEIASKLIKQYGKVIVYRWNGGSNAGHTVVLGNKKVILHQIPSGALIKNAIVILGKGMVIHPGDLCTEIKSILIKNKLPSKLLIDEQTPLALDTHRAFESILKKWESGGAGSTGRGISPAYADVIYRHPMRMRDLVSLNWKSKFQKHFELYKALISGFDEKIETIEVNTLDNGLILCGSNQQFLKRLEIQRKLIGKYVKDVYDIINNSWKSKIPFIFEGAQGVGLDLRWGVYPDVTASDPTFSGISYSTEGLVDPDRIEIKANVLKATYMSSVGKRVLPSKMNEALAKKIRDDANEYGATTKRPRDIYNIDIPALKYFSMVSKPTHIILTHLDISYLDNPIKVCVEYRDLKGNVKNYRPDQLYLNNLKPVYMNFKPWNGNSIQNKKDYKCLPLELIKYIKYLSKELRVDIMMITTGPARHSVINLI